MKRLVTIATCALLAVPASLRADPPSVIAPPGLLTDPPRSACAHWNDENLNGKRDRDEKVHPIRHGELPTRAPDEVSEEKDERGHAVTYVWRRPLTDDEKDFSEDKEGVTRLTITRNEAGLVTEWKLETSPSHSDSMSRSVAYDDRGRVTAIDQFGPGNSSWLRSFDYAPDGRLIHARSSFAMGAYEALVKESQVITEGPRIVRWIVDEVSEFSCDSSDKDIQRMCRAKRLKSSDWVETSRIPRESVVTLEYDSSGRVRAKRTTTGPRDGQARLTAVYYEYDCPN